MGLYANPIVHSPSGRFDQSRHNYSIFLLGFWLLVISTGSDPYPMRFIRLKTPQRRDYHWRRETDQNLGLHFENRHRNHRGTHLKRLLRHIPTHITDYHHWI